VAPESLAQPPAPLPPVTVPAMGVWSSGDFALVEEGMTGSARYVTGPWRYERIDGPATGCNSTHPARSTRCCSTSSVSRARVPPHSPRPGGRCAQADAAAQASPRLAITIALTAAGTGAFALWFRAVLRKAGLRLCSSPA
jgi:hypothetical protein